VRAVLGPHRRVHRELGLVRRTSERLDDPRVLVIAETEPPVERFGHAPAPASARSSNEANIGWPPVGPTSGSTACPGWGIRPTTGPPRSANRRTSFMIGANRAIAPHRR